MKPREMAYISTPAGLIPALERATAEHLAMTPQAVGVDTLAQREDWAFGMVVVPGQVEVDAHPDMMLFLARETPSGWEAAIEPTPAFDGLAAEAPPQLVPEEVGEGVEIRALLGANCASHPDWPFCTAGAEDWRLSFPWPEGEAWALRGGPHPSDAPDVWDALDFNVDATPNGSGRVVAAREGRVYLPCKEPTGRGTEVCLRHPGWDHITCYGHLRDIAVADLEFVSRGQFLGMTDFPRSTVALPGRIQCTGSSNGTPARHVHFHLKRTWGRRQQPIHAKWIGGGWIVLDGNAPYEGALLNTDTRRMVNVSSTCQGDHCPQPDRILNTGGIGMGRNP